MKRIFLLFLTLTLLLAGCGTEFPGADPPETIQTMVPATEPTGMTEPTTAPSALPFSLQLPAGWYSRSIVSHTTNDVTVSIDGQETFTVTYTDNAPGAKAKDRELTAEGYTYFAEDGEHFFYYKFHREVPEELVESLDGEKPAGRGNDIVFDYIVKEVFRFKECNNAYDVQLQYTYLYSDCSLLDCWMPLNTTSYTNYRLGVSVNIPSDIWDVCELRSNGYEFSLYTYEEDRTEWSFGDTYNMCTFVACPPDSDAAWLYGREGILFSTADTLYISINYWQPPVDRDGKTIFTNISWCNYPDHIKERFTTEEVQQIVDSFTILDSNP